MPKWIRVRAVQTGHQFDIDARTLPHRVGVEPLNDPRWPDVEGPRAVPRPAKPFVGKDGKAQAPVRERRRNSKTSSPADTPVDPDISKE